MTKSPGCAVFCFQVFKRAPIKLRLVERLWPRKWHAIDNAYAGRGESTNVYSGALSWGHRDVARPERPRLDMSKYLRVGEDCPHLIEVHLS